VAKESILVVDDEENILDLVRYNLEKEGYRVTCVGSGEEALEMAQRPILWQLFPSYLLITLFSLVAVTVYAYYIVSEIYLEVKSADLHSRVYLVENQVEKYIQYPETNHIDSLCKIK